MTPVTKRLAYLEKNWQSMDIHLSKEELAALDKLSDQHSVVGSR